VAPRSFLVVAQTERVTLPKGFELDADKISRAAGKGRASIHPDMRAFFKAETQLEQDEIASRSSES
jgi:hypothetical protein